MARLGGPVRMVFVRHALCMTALGLLFFAGSAWADPVTLRAGSRGAGARIVFDWPQPVAHSARLQGQRVVVTFDRQMEGALSSLSGRLPEWISAASLAADGRTLTITLQKPAALQTFASGNRIVLDLAPAAVPSAALPSARRVTPPARPAVAAPSPRQVPPQTKPPVDTPAAPTALPPTPAPHEQEAPQPQPQPQPEPEPSSPATEAPAEAAHPAPADSAAPDSEPQAQPAQPEAAIEHGQEVLLPSATHDQADAPSVQAAPEVVPVAQAVIPNTTLSKLEMTVPPGTPVAAFRRGSSLFVVVSDKNTPREMIPLVGPALASSHRVELLPAQGGRVIRVDLGRDEIQPEVQSTEGGWQLQFASPQPTRGQSIELEQEPDYSLGPRLLLKVGSPANPVTFVDPVLGDTLTAVPVATAGQGVVTGQRFVQAELLPTLQGVVVRPWADDLNVLSSQAGVEISATSALVLPEALRAEAEAVAGATVQNPEALGAPTVPQLPALFDFAALGAPAGEGFFSQREALQNAVISAAEEEKPEARLALARFYFINGMPTESAAVWGMVAPDREELAQRPEYPLIRAIAAFSSGTDDEAKAALAAVGQPTTDLALWRGFLAVKERDWVAASEQFRSALSRIWDYPEPYQSRLAVAAIEMALNTQDFMLAEQILGRLSTNQRAAGGRLSPAAEYLTGVLDWNQGREDEARAHLGSAATSWNQYWRVRAELALIYADAKKEGANPYDLLRQVERMRYAWRGDALEFDILHRLSQLHLDAGEYAAAFEDFSQMVSKFPADPRTPGLAEEQRAAFMRIFQGEGRDKTPAFVQLAIWDRFPEFRPTQPEILDGIRTYLADQVAGIELLDRAAGFYSEVLSNTTDAEQRARLGVRIAGLRLLDGNAADALKALQETEPSSASGQPQVLPEALRDERRIVKARAVFEQGKPDEALAMLINDYSEPAMRLRADITWQSKRWPEAAAVLNTLVGDLPADGTLSEEKAGMVISRATALALAGDKSGLAALRVKFGEPMARTHQAAAFQLLTRPEIAGGIPDRNTLSGSMAEVDLFQQFLDRYRAPTVPAAAGAPGLPSTEASADVPVAPAPTPQPAQDPGH